MPPRRLTPLLFLLSIPLLPAAAAPIQSVSIDHFARRTIYHSPQTPGYTCWVGAWLMPDGALMVTFKQATGPIDGRPRSTDLLKKWGLDASNPRRDFTGLHLANVYLRSTDAGLTWTKVAEDPFPGPLDRPSWGGSHVAMFDGAILRATDGSQLPLVPTLPRRIFFHRSRNLGKTWGPPEVPPEPKRPADDVLGDFGDCISRVRRLPDGRLLATGVARPSATDRRLGQPVVMISRDEAKTWQPQKVQLPAEARGPGSWDEWDSASLPSGDLLCVFRRADPKSPNKQVRWQGILKHKSGDEWALESYHPAAGLEHSGHPELLATREGVILHIATSATHWTADAGQTWRPLTPKNSQTPYRSRYYPRSLQTPDGQIFVFAHLGWDNGYGDYDQSIVMDTFRLTTE